MRWIEQLLGWVGTHESVLSGIAALIAIGAVMAAMTGRTLGLYQSRDRQADTPRRSKPVPNLAQDVGYCRVPGGSKIAWASAGKGYPLVRSLGWFTNLDMEWDSPVSSVFWQKLAQHFRLIRYDGRGMGLSDRDVSEFSPRTRLEDLEAVIEASGIERFALLGMSEGGTTAIRYAVAHPERVSHLVLWGSFARTPSNEDALQIAAIAKLVPKFWGTENAAFHQMFTATFLPDGNAAENKLFNDLQRTSATAPTADLFLKSLRNIDVRDSASQIRVPTLVLHRKGDLAIPVHYGKELASLIPGARLVLLDGNNHWFATDDKSVDTVFALIAEFIAA